MESVFKRILPLWAIILVMVFALPVISHAEEGATTEVTLDDLAGKRAGVISGTPQDQMVYDNIKNPVVMYFNSFSDLALSLDTGKIDYFVNSTIGYRMMRASHPDFIYADTVIRVFDIGTIFPMTEAGKELSKQFDEYVDQISGDGTLDGLKEYWLYPHDWKPIDIPQKGPNGILKFATCSSNKPFAMVIDGKYGGFEVALVAGFCEAYGYGLSINDMDFSGILSGITAEKYDLAAAQISWTAERAKSVLFSDTYCLQEMVPIIKASNYGIEVSGLDGTKENSFLDSIKNSFKRTFLEESRWKLILSGVGITLVITIFGFMLANVFGAIFCMMALSKSKFLHILTDIYSRLMQGLPVVVILMLLYYIILGKTDISGILVAIIGFGITSGAYLAQLFEGSIRSVSQGQWEATLALGFTKKEAFFGIVFPQAVRGMLPGYFSQIISLMKGTAIVGYIAVVDLTKAGDIIRSTTYEAFFPLIAVAAIYFAIASLLLSLLKQIQKKLAPKRKTSGKGGEKA